MHTALNNAIGSNTIAGKNTLTIDGIPAIGINITTIPPNNIVNAIAPAFTDCLDITTASLVTKNGIIMTIANMLSAIEANLAYQCLLNIGSSKDPAAFSILFN